MPQTDTISRRKEQPETLKAETVGPDNESWHKKPATLISIVALVFSFGTTAFSAFNSHQEDVRSNRRDVRALLQRLSKLPLENYELMQKYKSAAEGQALSGMINQENILLATQASELIDRYPNSFEATEYYAIAIALANSNIMGKVPKLFQRAMDLATNSNDYSVAARAYGSYLYSKGEYSEGKRLYAEALNVWNKFPERNSFVVNGTDLVTQMYWSQAEIGVGNKQAAQERLAEARKKLTALPPGPMTDSLKGQIDYTARFIE